MCRLHVFLNIMFGMVQKKFFFFYVKVYFSCVTFNYKNPSFNLKDNKLWLNFLNRLIQYIGK